MNRSILILISLILLAFLVYILSGNTEKTYAVKVDLPVLRAMEYFSDSTQLNQWMVPFDSSTSYHQDKLVKGEDSLTLTKFSAFQMSFRRSDPRGYLNYSIDVVPQKDSAFNSFFVLKYSIPRWQNIFGNRFAKQAEASIDSLKMFLSNPERLYGFTITGEQVTDTAFLFASRQIRKADFAEETKAIFDMLISEADNRDAGYNGVRIFHYQDTDSIRHIYAGIGIIKKIPLKEGEKISYKLMPYQKNLLVLDYQGRYKDITRAYSALEKFRADFGFITMAIPFHKYLDPGYGFEDSAKVHVKVCYPVF
jgi:hypothetical protein